MGIPRSTLPRSCRAVTLVELLVVMGIIAIVTGGVLSAVSQARVTATRAGCLNKQRQLAMGLLMYCNLQRGYYPRAFEGSNPVASNHAYYPFVDLAGPRFATMKGIVADPRAQNPVRPGYYTHLGQLYATGVLRDPSVFYCPASKLFTYPESWDLPPETKRRAGGYIYRVHGQALGRRLGVTLMQADSERLNSLKVGQVRGTTALTACVFNFSQPIPHVRPYGVSVGFADGHAEFKRLTATDYAISLASAGGRSMSLFDADWYQELMFRAFETNEYDDIRNEYRRYY